VSILGGLKFSIEDRGPLPKARRKLDAVPGSPEPFDPPPPKATLRPRHPAALLTFTLLVSVGIALANAPLALTLLVVAFAALALRAEGKRPRGEVPFLALAAVLFLAHAALGRFHPAPTAGALLLALRLLGLVYVTRWAARSFLPGAAHWLLQWPLPPRPRALALAAESARFAAVLLPMAAREAEGQTTALRARGVRAARGWGGRARFAAAWLLPFLGSMLRVGDAMSDALQARGYRAGARRRGLETPAWGAVDVGLLLLGAALAGVLVRGV
jgi:energy-coupling factor transporter transmembrane protein EcfT